jgi:hypothetical protein
VVRIKAGGQAASARARSGDREGIKMIGEQWPTGWNAATRVLYHYSYRIGELSVDWDVFTPSKRVIEIHIPFNKPQHWRVLRLQGRSTTYLWRLEPEDVPGEVAPVLMDLLRAAGEL